MLEARGLPLNPDPKPSPNRPLQRVKGPRYPTWTILKLPSRAKNNKSTNPEAVGNASLPVSIKNFRRKRCQILPWACYLPKSTGEPQGAEKEITLAGTILEMCPRVYKMLSLELCF